MTWSDIACVHCDLEIAKDREERDGHRKNDCNLTAHGCRQILSAFCESFGEITKCVVYKVKF